MHTGNPPSRSTPPRAASPWAAIGLAGLAALAVSLPLGCSATGDATAGAEPAKAAVVTFLEAVKRGDDAAARGMLTKLARLKTEELGISVAPPVADSATYSVRECEMVGDGHDLAHVGTTWTDMDSEGFKTTENVVWVVRLDPEGWRVVGMAMRVFDDMPPLLLNFEDPEDMLAKQELGAKELHKRAEAAAQETSADRTARGSDSRSKVQ
jgi:hypothetical protein